MARPGVGHEALRPLLCPKDSDLEAPQCYASVPRGVPWSHPPRDPRNMSSRPSADADSAAPASLLTGENAAYVDQLWSRWNTDPASVDTSWAELFASWEQVPSNGGLPPGQTPRFARQSIFRAKGGAAGDSGVIRGSDPQGARRQAMVATIINAYRVRGHTEAGIDPLGRREHEPHPELTIGYYGLTEADLDVPVSGSPAFGIPETTTLRHILQRMRTAYCGAFGVEFMNIGDPEKKKWLQRRLETLQDRQILDDIGQRRMLRMISDAENFEQLLHARFPGTKRFSIEGGESLVPMLDVLIDECGARGIREIVLGMAHRGRLNVLANILEKPVADIVSEFEGTAATSFEGSGDVKYHLGYSSTYETPHGSTVDLALAFNPSHLEAVDPVVAGRVRARQDREGSESYRHIMPLMLHGDAAFAGQGLVAEVLNQSGLKGYRTGGTIHVIVNNQIGFTTSPADARSTMYCTDVARMLAVPIFHVNGEDPWAVAAVARLAAEWRQTYHEDVIIDLYCFRKHGHNEGDEPSFTQPLLYDAIRSHAPPRVNYARRLTEDGSLSQEQADGIFNDSKARLQELLDARAQESRDAYVGNPDSKMGRLWGPYVGAASIHDDLETGVAMERLVDLLEVANTIPDGFEAHRKIKRLMRQRMEIVRGERPVDWAVAEQAAYATIATEGLRVRLSGQDSGRGTFSHRHAVLTDIATGGEYVPLQHLAEDQAPFEVYDSLLSEAGVLGFEYGYTLDCPDSLVLWEAQFGDFANGAQVIIDNFIMSTEQKWARNSGVVMLLPHGYEGQGPEHSSARLERYLQLCAEDNVVVANCTTPASFFHLLRRQALLKVRKPLVVMSPKSLLRHPRCVSKLEDLTKGSFKRVIDCRKVQPEEVERVVFCSGKVFYDLLAAREEREQYKVALVRLEQLYPFPEGEVQACFARYPESAEIVWCQEEPRNMGAWPMMDEWFFEALGRVPRYIGRDRAASPATGSPKKHRAEHDAVIEEALYLEG